MHLAVCPRRLGSVRTHTAEAARASGLDLVGALGLGRQAGRGLATPARTVGDGSVRRTVRMMLATAVHIRTRIEAQNPKRVTSAIPSTSAGHARQRGMARVTTPAVKRRSMRRV